MKPKDSNTKKELGRNLDVALLAGVAGGSIILIFQTILDYFPLEFTTKIVSLIIFTIIILLLLLVRSGLYKCEED